MKTEMINKLLDILLLPKGLYKRLTNKKTSLYIGIIFIGLIDLGFDLFDRYSEIFSNRTQGDLIFNIFLTVVFIVAFGIIDVLFFTIPLFDLFKRFRKSTKLPLNKDTIGIISRNIKEREIKDKGLMVKLMKVYIASHLPIVPAEIFIFLISENIVNGSSNITWLILVVSVIGILIPIWFSAAIAKGINVLYEFRPLFKRMVFVIIFVWNILLVYAFTYMKDKWILVLFK